MSVVNDSSSMADNEMQRVLDRLDRQTQETFLSEMSAAIDLGDGQPARVLHEWVVSLAFRGEVLPDVAQGGPIDLDAIAAAHGIDMDELRRAWAGTSSTTGTT